MFQLNSRVFTGQDPRAREVVADRERNADTVLFTRAYMHDEHLVLESRVVRRCRRDRAPIRLAAKFCSSFQKVTFGAAVWAKAAAVDIRSKKMARECFILVWIDLQLSKDAVSYPNNPNHAIFRIRQLSKDLFLSKQICQKWHRVAVADNDKSLRFAF